MRLQKMTLVRGKETTLAPNQVITSLGKNDVGELVIPIHDIEGKNIFYLSLIPEDINRIYEFHKSSKKNTMYFT